MTTTTSTLPLLLLPLLLLPLLAHTPPAAARVVFDGVTEVATSAAERDDPVAAMAFDLGASAASPVGAPLRPLLVPAAGGLWGSQDGGDTFSRLFSGKLTPTIDISDADSRAPRVRLAYGSNIPTFTATPVTTFTGNQSLSYTFDPRSGNFSTSTTDRKTVFRGLPRPSYELSTASGNAVRLNASAWLAVAVVWFVPDQAHPERAAAPLPGPCCNDSVVAFVSTDAGQTWDYVATVAERVAGSEEGPNECSVALLPDGHTLVTIFRVDGGDGEPDHPHKPYMLARSEDGGHSWSAPVPLPADVLSAKPETAVVPAALGIVSAPRLLLTGGRPALALWENLDNGVGERWASYDIPFHHNQLVGSAEQRFCSAFVNATLSLGWAQSCAYNSLVATGPGQGLVCYERQSGNSGGYHKPVPADCRVDGATIFCMRFHIEDDQ